MVMLALPRVHQLVSLVIVPAATFIGGIANLAAIVGFMVTATAGLPDTVQGLASGLTTVPQ
ncbi:hypothetical protein D3C86_2264770 [compost metagenome]